MNDSRLRVVVVTDGIAGHEHQAEGLCRWLQRRRDLSVQRVTATLRLKALSRLLLPRLSPAGSDRALRQLRLFYRTGAVPSAADLVVSMGGNTSFANILLREHYRCPNVYLGSLRRLDPAHITAHMTLEPTGHPNNLVTPISPNLIEPEIVAGRGATFRADRGLAGRLWTLVIGGTGAGFTYGVEDWRRLAQWAAAVADSEGIRWLLSTSPRTGREGEKTLREALDERVIAYGIWWNRQPEKALDALMGAGEHVVVTADSMSMVSEAITTGKPVTVLELPGNDANRRYRAALARFRDAGMCQHRPLTLPPTCPIPAAPRAGIPEIIEQTLDRLEALHAI